MSEGQEVHLRCKSHGWVGTSKQEKSQGRDCITRPPPDGFVESSNILLRTNLVVDNNNDDTTNDDDASILAQSSSRPWSVVFPPPRAPPPRAPSTTTHTQNAMVVKVKRTKKGSSPKTSTHEYPHLLLGQMSRHAPIHRIRRRFLLPHLRHGETLRGRLGQRTPGGGGGGDR